MILVLGPKSEVSILLGHVGLVGLSDLSGGPGQVWYNIRVVEMQKEWLVKTLGMDHASRSWDQDL